MTAPSVDSAKKAQPQRMDFRAITISPLTLTSLPQNAMLLLALLLGESGNDLAADHRIMQIIES